MGKRLKKKTARNAHKEKDKEKDKRLHNSSLETQTSVIADVDANGGVQSMSQKESKGCAHILEAIDLPVVSSKIESTQSPTCLSCREGSNQRKSRKDKTHHKTTWVCLQCGFFSCGGVSLPNTPQSHALRHLRLTRHPLVIQFHHPFLIWCFSCSSLQSKDLFPDLVALLKSKSQPQPQPQSQPSSVDVEDIWFGGGSIVNEVKPAVGNGNDSYAVKGLVNLGNTCFFNSVLQNLLAMDTLRDYLLNFEGSMGPLMSSLKKIFVETSLESNPKNVVNPKPLFGCVCAKAPQFRGYRQQDSHELLRCLLDGLSFEDLHEKKSRNSSVSKGHFRASFVDAIFGGQTSSTVCCVECGHSSVVYEPFLDLSLPVPTKKPPPKKTQPIPRTKKKLPPKRGNKICPKLNKNGDIGPAPNSSNTSTHTQCFSDSKSNSLECGSSSNLVESNIVVHENDMPQEPQMDVECESRLNDNNLTSQIDSSQEADCFTWMDYLEPVSLLEVPNSVSENENLSLPQYLETHNDNHNTVYKQNTNKPRVEDSLYQDSVPNMSNSSGVEVCVNSEEVNNKSETIVNGWDDECPPQVKDNEVLLLTYKEDGAIEGESLGIFDGEDSLGFDGLGNLFDENEENEDGVKNTQVSENAGNGFLAGNNTESDLDEVDDTNSPVSVESCLASFVKLELLTGEHAWHCENCSKLLKEEKQRKTLLTLGDESIDECSSSEVLQGTNHNSDNSETNYVDARQTNGLGRNLREEEKCCTSESVNLNPSDEISLDSNHDHIEGPSLQNEEQELGKDEEKEEHLKSVKVMRDATKRILISKIPQILTIHLKRFAQDNSGRLSKLNGHVGFKEYINLEHYMDSRYLS